jgi:hypothetical protein
LAFKFSDLCPNKCTWPWPKCFPLCRHLTFVRCYAFTPNDHAMFGREDGFDAIAVLDSFHLVLVIFSPSLEVCGSEEDYDSLMCGLLGYIFACPCGPRFKAMFTLRGRLRDPTTIDIFILIVKIIFYSMISIVSIHRTGL